uniref:Uncharacterized protein n=1 Tax=Magallana gigas TaxID=29159 RepID=A0A8W8NIS6_MAGGI
MASSIITVISACVLVSSVCTVYTINAENIFSSPATDLPSQNAQLLEACFNLCRFDDHGWFMRLLGRMN